MDDQKIKENSQTKDHKKCVCSSLQGLFVPNRQLSVAASGCITMLFFSFMAGYFFGGQHAAQDFMCHVDHASFNDQMSSSLCVLAKECTMVDAADNVIDNEDNSFQECVINEIDSGAPMQVIETKKVEEQYYAQLIGFGTLQAAQRFAKKLESRHVAVEINKHCSRTAKGKTINWYQVITLPYNNKQELLDLVDMIKKTEKIQDARIVMC